jgi:methylenetetrahydrofolate dehydrogenase (NADP+)/methenyltetrahydrofolate cyclohydrolase
MVDQKFVTDGVISGKAISDDIRSKLAEEISKMDPKPFLATILVGDDPASQIYVNYKEKGANAIGMRNKIFRLPADSSQKDVENQIIALNEDPDVDGILLQLPLPGDLEETKATMLIDPSKDVDGLHYVNVGKFQIGMKGAFVPCTPSGCMDILDYCDVDIEGKDAVVIGRSNLVGRPMVKLLESRNATVTLCHSRTKDLAEKVSRADILIVAAGRAEMVKGDWVKEGAVVIDVGTNRTDDGLKGDVEFDIAKQKAALITPVPGGVGPLTITNLLRNTVKSYKQRRG